MTNIDVKLIRNRLGLSQVELGKMIGVSRNTIANYEKGGVIPESKRDILLNLINKSENANKAHGYILTSGDNNISNTGSIGGSINSNNDIEKLKRRIKELEKENSELKNNLYEMSMTNGKLVLELSKLHRKK